jgi:hypothetical protein
MYIYKKYKRHVIRTKGTGKFGNGRSIIVKLITMARENLETKEISRSNVECLIMEIKVVPRLL